MVTDQSRTFHANEAVHLSDLINLKFSPERYGTANPRFVRVTEPDGPSTDGGLKARQAVLLCSQRDPEDRGLICGHVGVRTKDAELRSYAYVKHQFEARYKRDLDLTRGEYNRFIEALQDFLSTQGYRSSILNAPRSGSFARPAIGPAPVPAAVPGISVMWIAVALAYGFGFLTCYLLFRFQIL
ncbi:MAG: hypothetical protein KC933_22815 [Myxococcales bacterium]|nr:hypothetical protein [Myxococcales bacterium]MCB9646019.1 hypothetical protein [Deltaproteobacteria bacterium]